MLSGDIIQVFPDRKQVSFLYSYSNYIPLPASAIERHGPPETPIQAGQVVAVIARLPGLW